MPSIIETKPEDTWLNWAWTDNLAFRKVEQDGKMYDSSSVEFSRLHFIVLDSEGEEGGIPWIALVKMKQPENFLYIEAWKTGGFVDVAYNPETLVKWSMSDESRRRLEIMF